MADRISEAMTSLWPYARDAFHQSQDVHAKALAKVLDVSVDEGRGLLRASAVSWDEPSPTPGPPSAGDRSLLLATVDLEPTYRVIKHEPLNPLAPLARPDLLRPLTKLGEDAGAGLFLNVLSLLWTASARACAWRSADWADRLASLTALVGVDLSTWTLVHGPGDPPPKEWKTVLGRIVPAPAAWPGQAALLVPQVAGPQLVQLTQTWDLGWLFADAAVPTVRVEALREFALRRGSTAVRIDATP